MALTRWGLTSEQAHAALPCLLPFQAPCFRKGLGPSAAVSGDTLFLESGPFTTSQPIQVTVRLPGDKLATINHLAGLYSVYVAPGG